MYSGYTVYYTSRFKNYSWSKLVFLTCLFLTSFSLCASWQKKKSALWRQQCHNSTLPHLNKDWCKAYFTSYSMSPVLNEELKELKQLLFKKNAFIQQLFVTTCYLIKRLLPIGIYSEHFNPLYYFYCKDNILATVFFLLHRLDICI